MTVRIHPPEDPAAFADLLLSLLAASALSRAAGEAESAPRPRGEAARQTAGAESGAAP